MPLMKSKIAVAESGTLNGLKEATQVATPAQLAQVETIKKTVGKAVAKATSDTTMSKADWASKDRRISRQGLFQACLGSVGLLQLNTGNTLEDYLRLVERAADAGLEYVNKA